MRTQGEHNAKVRLSIPCPSPEKPSSQILRLKKTDLRCIYSFVIDFEKVCIQIKRFWLVLSSFKLTIDFHLVQPIMDIFSIFTLKIFPAFHVVNVRMRSFENRLDTRDSIK